MTDETPVLGFHDSYPDEAEDPSIVSANRPLSGATLPERADEVERLLGSALKSYRQRAEEILEEHFQAMERTQNLHDHEVSALKAENIKLRELLGKQHDPAFLQNVLFQSMTAEECDSKKKKDLKNKMKSGGGDDDDKRLTAKKKVRGKKEQEQPGGSWQQFMAWVPNGAALMNPEPWKPLAQSMQIQANAGTAKLDKQVLANEKQGGENMWGVVPASQNSPRNGRSTTVADDDSDASFDETRSHAGLGKLELYDCWKPSEREKKKASQVDTSSACRSERSSLSSSDLERVDSGFNTGPSSRFILNPDAGVRIAWDLGSLCMVIYDMVMIPMMAFDLPDDPGLIAMDWTTRIFWTLDMGASCITGVVLADGSVSYEVSFILKRYLKSWFCLDFFIVGSDWSGVIFASGGLGLSKLARVSRVARIVRLLRLVRMQEVIANITERIQSDNSILALAVLKLFVFLMFCCHLFACGWWGVGSSSSGKSWISVNGYNNVALGLQYLVSLHWSLSQFSGGMEEFVPASGVERSYAVLIWVISFMSGLVMLSFLTSRLTQQYIIGGSGARQMATLKKYLNQNKIPKNLIKRICRSAKHAISGDLQPDTVDLLNVVSEPLKVEMHFEMYSRVLHGHPFFRDFLLEGEDQVMKRVCHSCMSTLFLDTGDILFHSGDDAMEGKMYFIRKGTLEYTDKFDDKTIVFERQYVAEPVLWTQWKHQGTLKAITDSTIALLDAESFQDVCTHYLKKSKGRGFNPKKYAAAFIDELNHLEEWSDLPLASPRRLSIC